MLEYPTQEAETLLKEKLKAATISLSQVEEDLEFLREQITTAEVSKIGCFNKRHGSRVQLGRQAAQGQKVT